MIISGFVSQVFAQDCAGLARGNDTGRYFLMTYDTEAERDAALANITTITINGTNYNVGPHPTGSRTIRTTPARPVGTFSDPFTGTVTLNFSGEMCDYAANILPVTLAYIDAKIEQSTVVIKWETALEVNNAGFEVQRSSDGRIFETITWVEGVGSTSQSQYYEAKDTDYASGFNYYRLRQIDFDGGVEYSPTVAVNAIFSDAVTLQSNMVTKGQEVTLLGASTGAFEILNAVGDKVGSGFIDGADQSVSTGNLDSGIYFISMARGTVLKFMIR